MGDYIGMRMKAKVKKEYSDMVEEVFYGDLDWKDYTGEFEFLRNFVSTYRASCTPFGSICYMPESWSEWSPDYGEDIKDGFDCKYVKESRYIYRSQHQLKVWQPYYYLLKRFARTY